MAATTAFLDDYINESTFGIKNGNVCVSNRELCMWQWTCCFWNISGMKVLFQYYETVICHACVSYNDGENLWNEFAVIFIRELFFLTRMVATARRFTLVYFIEKLFIHALKIRLRKNNYIFSMILLYIYFPSYAIMKTSLKLVS